MCLPDTIILIDSVFKVKTCYPQIFLEECKYRLKEESMKSFINEDLAYPDSKDKEKLEENELINKKVSN